MHKLEMGELTLDLNHNLLHRNDAEVHLEQKPLLLLLFLMAHAGEVINKDRILRTIWCGRVVSDEVISVAISQVRKALADKVRSPRFIKTLPGAGYQFIFQLKREVKLHAQQYLQGLFKGKNTEVSFPEMAAPVTEPVGMASILTRVPVNALMAVFAWQVFTVALTVMLTLHFSTAP